MFNAYLLGGQDLYAHPAGAISGLQNPRIGSGELGVPFFTITITITITTAITACVCEGVVCV
jgi:hypothetical protein